MTILQISIKLGLKRGTIASWVRGYCRRPGYLNEIREEAKKLAEQGLSRSQISRRLNVPVFTVSKWVIGINSNKQGHSSEVRKEAERMIKSGLSKSTVAKMLNVPLGTLSKWNIPSPNPPIKYPKKTKEAAVNMFRQGIMLSDISMLLSVPESTIQRWTLGIGSRRRNYSGKYFLTLVELINNGYYEPKGNDDSLFSALRNYV